MNKSNLINTLSEKLPNLSRNVVENIVDTIFSSMTGVLSKGERIEIRGFGSFEIRTRRAKLGRNPKTGEKVQVQEKKVPFFRTGKELKEMVNT